MKIPHPDNWPEPVQIGTTLVLLLALAYLIKPRNLVSFIEQVLDERTN